MQSDAELVNAVLGGEKPAFAKLVSRYQRPVRGIAPGVLRDYHSASDVSQDAFVRAYEELRGLCKAEAFDPWLMKITRRCSLDTARRRSGEASREPPAVSAVESPNGELDQSKRQLLAAVARLPSSERQVVMLRYFSGYSARDVGPIVVRSVGTITKQLSRAHKRLQNLLEGSEK
ncbi:MAG: sigma-70 family RNA polymerase sigma factor [Phycisphaerales bacterium]|nr:MAG: sigma-70 family RNA polymerase sigma factor [Phycisphaerales bacterium]